MLHPDNVIVSVLRERLDKPHEMIHLYGHGVPLEGLLTIYIPKMRDGAIAIFVHDGSVVVGFDGGGPSIRILCADPGLFDKLDAALREFYGSAWDV